MKQKKFTKSDVEAAIVMSKTYTRQLRDEFISMRESLDGGDCREYELLDKCEAILKNLRENTNLIQKAIDNPDPVWYSNNVEGTIKQKKEVENATNL